jgi:mannose-1-phosphate guanylyltransferase/mannose-1-phosphate guanylyltransferase/phosphomannomutase
MRAMVLAAGLGKRLRPLTFAIPKPLAPVANRAVMEHILELLAGQGFDEVIANTSHLGEQIQERFGDGSGLGVSLAYSEEEELLGTAGGVRNVADFLTGGDDDSFLIISGDALTDIDLRAMRERHESHDGIATLAVKKVADTREYGVVIHGPDGRVEGFQEKPDPAEALSDLGNCGIYMFRREIFDHFPEEAFVDWAMDVFPTLLERDVSFYVHEFSDYWNDIGSLDEYRQGNFDALAGAVRLNVGGAETPPEADAEIAGPALFGAGCEIGDGAWLHGPLVVGDGARIGAGAKLREAVVLPGAEVPSGAALAGAIVLP